MRVRVTVRCRVKVKVKVKVRVRVMHAVFLACMAFEEFSVFGAETAPSPGLAFGRVKGQG